MGGKGDNSNKVWRPFFQITNGAGNFLAILLLGMEMSMKIRSGLKVCKAVTTASPSFAKTRSTTKSCTLFLNTNWLVFVVCRRQNTHLACAVLVCFFRNCLFLYIREHPINHGHMFRTIIHPPSVQMIVLVVRCPKPT